MTKETKILMPLVDQYDKSNMDVDGGG